MVSLWKGNLHKNQRLSRACIVHLVIKQQLFTKWANMEMASSQKQVQLIHSQVILGYTSRLTLWFLCWFENQDGCHHLIRNLRFVCSFHVLVRCRLFNISLVYQYFIIYRRYFLFKFEQFLWIYNIQHSKIRGYQRPF